MKVQRKVELLAPASNFEVGVAAIDAGADALYIGAVRFSARSGVGNSIADIGRLVDYARCFGVRVYLALNTMFRDAIELGEARDLAFEAIGVGVSGVIFQDVRVLDMGLGVELHASTQVNMESVERAKLFRDAGVSRIVLERGLSIGEVRAISDAVGGDIELEAFVHGAICVGSSGVCYLSEHLTGRSGNRGECAQPCRSRYDLLDGAGRVVLRDLELLSPRDLNLSERLDEILGAGVSSLKIEGRLKGMDYVSNVVGYYNRELERLGVERTSWGRSRPVGYEPVLERSFNRGFTQWYFDGVGNRGGRGVDVGGEFIGVVEEVEGSGCVRVRLRDGVVMGNGDGVVYRDGTGRVSGFRVNRVDGGRLFFVGDSGLLGAERLYRNFCSDFRPKNVRKIGVRVIVGDGLVVAEDSYGHRAEVCFEVVALAQNRERGVGVLESGFSKSGGTIFEVEGVEFRCGGVPFMRISEVNELRRELLVRLRDVCIEDSLLFGVVGGVAECSSFGVENLCGDWLLRTRYCLLGEYGICGSGVDLGGYRLRNNGIFFGLRFDCGCCRMYILRG